MLFDRPQHFERLRGRTCCVLPRNVHQNQIPAPRRVSYAGIDFGLSFRTQDQFTEWLVVPVKPIVTDHL